MPAFLKNFKWIYGHAKTPMYLGLVLAHDLEIRRLYTSGPEVDRRSLPGACRETTPRSDQQSPRTT